MIRGHQRARICIVTGIFPPDVGGPASYVPTISRELVKRGHTVRIVCLSDRPTHDDADYPFPVIRIRRGQPRPLRVLKTSGILLRLARQSNLLYVNGLYLEAMLAATLSGVPAVCKVVGDSAWERARNRGWFEGTLDQYQTAPKGLVLRLLDWLRTTPLHLSQRVIVPSRYLKEVVTSWGVSPEKLVVIRNSIDVRRPAPDKHVLPPFRGKTAVTVCRLVPWKGLHGLIRVFADLPAVRLVVVGDGPLREELLDLAISLGVSDRVVFMGDAPRETSLACMAQADIFVLNSSYEGLPHVLLEAMAMGVSVVATDAGGTREVIEDGDTGLLVPVGDESALKHALRRALDNPELAARLTRRAAQMLRTRFSYTQMVEQTERVLMDAAERNVRESP